MNEPHNIWHDSHRARGTPWVKSIQTGFLFDLCSSCGRSIARRNDQMIRLVLSKRKGVFWPDMLGCGSLPIFIVSETLLHIITSLHTSPVSSEQVLFSPPPPTALRNVDAKSYYWIDGATIAYALMDPIGSGFVQARQCPNCKRYDYDVAGTHRAHQDLQVRYSLLQNAPAGMHLFTTQFSPYIFFAPPN